MTRRIFPSPNPKFGTDPFSGDRDIGRRKRTEKSPFRRFRPNRGPNRKSEIAESCAGVASFFHPILVALAPKINKISLGRRFADDAEKFFDTVFRMPSSPNVRPPSFGAIPFTEIEISAVENGRNRFSTH